MQKENEYNDVELTINSKPLEPWDPFCRWLNGGPTPRVEIHKNGPITLTANVAGEDDVIGKFDLNVFILPTKHDLSQAELDRARYSLDNQGFHVFREGRMIFSGGWPNRLFVKEPHMNLIRVELSFDHKLDDHFQIDFKKSRIDLSKDLRKELKRILTPARNEANRRYRRGGKKTGNASLNDQHGKSSNAITKHHDENTQGSKIESVDHTNGTTEVRNKYGLTRIKLKLDDTQDRVVQTSATLQDAVLWEPGLVDGNRHAVFLNEAHEFYKRFYHANQDNPALIQAMDCLLWSLAEAELSVLSDTVKRNLEDMRISVSRSLRTLAEELPEIDELENDENEQ